MLQKTLRLPVVKRDDVSIDYLGAFLLVGGVSILLVWVSLGGQNFEWVSWTSALLVVGAVAVVGAAIHVEANVAKDPVIPLRLFKDRTLTLATIASVLIGVAMFGSTVYLSLYFQRAKDMSPTEAGLMSICMVGGLLVSSILSGRIISNTGVWKRWLVGGMVAVIAGIALLSTIDAGTPLWRTGLFMAVLGLGLGATMQNLVLAVQNTIALSDMGAGSSVVAFFRSLGGSVGIAALGAVLAHQVADAVQAGLTKLVAANPELAGRSATRPVACRTSSTLPAPIRAIFESAVRRRDRSHLPGGPAVRGGRADRRPLHQGGAPAHVGEARGRARGGGRRGHDLLRDHHEVRRPAPHRGRGRDADPPRQAGHGGAGPRGPPRPAPDDVLHPHPPRRSTARCALPTCPTRSAWTRAASAGRCRRWSTSASSSASRPPRTVAPSCSTPATRVAGGWSAMTRNRSDRFDERLSAWSDDELAGFGDQLSAYNRALSDD